MSRRPAEPGGTDDIVMLDADDSMFQTMLGALPQIPGASTDTVCWTEDNLEPCTPEEMARGLRDALAVAREHGWIPDRGEAKCDCRVCRMWDEWEAKG